MSGYRELLTERASRLIPMPLVRRITRRRPVGFFYHTVSERRLPHIANLYAYVTPAEFEVHVRYLKHRFDLVAPRELITAAKGDGALPDHPAFITFDDGLAECFTVVRPILLDHGVRCGFFVCNDFIDNRWIYHRHLASICIEALRSLEHDADELRFVLDDLGRLAGRRIDSPPEFATWILSLDEARRTVIERVAERLGVDGERYLRAQQPYMTSEQLATLVDEGFEVGAHGLGHRRLSGLPGDELRHEIVTSCRLLRSSLGLASVGFSFPFSGEGIERADLKEILECNEFIDVFFDSGGLADDEPHVLHRIWAERPLASGNRPTRLDRILKRAMLVRLGRWIRRALGLGQPASHRAPLL